MLRKVISILLVVISVPAFAQVSFQFIPELYGRNIDGLLNLRIVNVSGPKVVTLNLSVTERKSGKIVSIRTEPFTLNNGNATIPASAIRNSKIQFGGNRVSAAVQQNGYFPEGDYEYCFTLNSAFGTPNPEVYSDQCFNYELVPSAPLSLTEPYNQDKICEKRPLLAWQPSFPQIPGSAYQLVLVEIKERQNATEALNYNLPIVRQSGIVNPVLSYPPSSKELQAGKKYAWQVSVYKNQTVINRSEVWEFTVGCDDNMVTPGFTDDGYRDIEDLLKGNYYMANGSVKLSVMNSYGPQDLHYEISCITDAKLKIKRLPKLKLENGRNKVFIILDNRRVFKEDYYYILKIWLPDGSIKSLRFKYNDQI